MLLGPPFKIWFSMNTETFHFHKIKLKTVFQCQTAQWSSNIYMQEQKEKKKNTYTDFWWYSTKHCFLLFKQITNFPHLEHCQGDTPTSTLHKLHLPCWVPKVGQCLTPAQQIFWVGWRTLGLKRWTCGLCSTLGDQPTLDNILLAHFNVAATDRRNFWGKMVSN